ncbi:MoxR-like ATPase [Bradyrhizobium sp. GM22.5]
MAESVEKLEDGIVRSAEQVSSQIRAAKDAIASVIFGQDRVIENTLVTILSGGHALLIGVPGLAKTKLVETLGITLGLDAKRIQFTPDLMPSDILGAEVLDESTSGKRAFRFISGPVFAQLLMADEINRASPAHAVGAAAGDAGAAHHRCRRASRSAEAVPRARHAKPAGAGRHLSAA